MTDVSAPLRASYTHHSPTPTADGPYMLGVDEAGRGPVLGPLVYGVAYCPVAWKEDLEELGFADSKTLTAESRSKLLETLSSEPDKLGWSVRVVCPQALSSGMLRRPPVNLNRQSEEATMLLIREVLKMGLELTEVYVDALGNCEVYQKQLSSAFPGISFTVTPKADSKFKIVGAASVAAKVTRDAWVEGWLYEEDDDAITAKVESEVISAEDPDDGVAPATVPRLWGDVLGSGYPSDPKTQEWLRTSVEPTFGFPSNVRFSWTTVKVLLDKHAHAVKWTDDDQKALAKAFEGATGRDKDRCTVARDLALKTVASL